MKVKKYFPIRIFSIHYAYVALVFIVTIILAVLLLTSCGEEHQSKKIVDGYEIIVVDSCEYLIRHYDHGGVMAHKGNCRYCAERNRKMMKEQLDTALYQVFD